MKMYGVHISLLNPCLKHAKPNWQAWDFKCPESHCKQLLAVVRPTYLFHLGPIYPSVLITWLKL